MKNNFRQDYDKGLDILSVYWGEKTKHSIELFEGQLVLDIDKKDNIVGLEIFNFKKELDKFNKKMRKIFGEESPKRAKAYSKRIRR